VAGYSGTPLLKKLGIKPGQAALLLNVPGHLTEINAFDAFSLVRKSLRNPRRRHFDYIHLFAKDRSKLAAMLPQITEALKADGMVWFSWPKKSSGINTDISGNVLRSEILPTGLVDVKVCAVDKTWSGLKFMFRKDLRSELD